MQTSCSHQARLRSVFECEWSRLADDHPAFAHADVMPLRWLAEELLHEIACEDASRDESLHDRVRRRVIDREFVGETGDTCMDPHYRVPLDIEVHLIATVIHRMLESHDYVPAT